MFRERIVASGNASRAGRDVAGIGESRGNSPSAHRVTWLRASDAQLDHE